MNEYLNVCSVNFIHSALVFFFVFFCLIRDGLQLSDISGAAYSK